MSQKKFLDSIGDIDRLQLIATKIRKNAIENITKSKVGQISWPFSISEGLMIPILASGRTS
jgi:hypothetical protein